MTVEAGSLLPFLQKYNTGAVLRLKSQTYILWSKPHWTQWEELTSMFIQDFIISVWKRQGECTSLFVGRKHLTGIILRCKRLFPFTVVLM